MLIYIDYRSILLLSILFQEALVEFLRKNFYSRSQNSCCFYFARKIVCFLFCSMIWHYLIIFTYGLVYLSGVKILGARLLIELVLHEKELVYVGVSLMFLFVFRLI